MELKRIELYNFSSYAGKVSFDCSISEGKNIILIGGNNGAGKTSLFTAIKMALYGPLCFHYQGKNAQYSARIKELMNHDAFLTPEVKTYVELEITLPRHQENVVYTIHREWTYSGKRVQEVYWVRDGSGMLSARDRDYFQNYLFTVVPPNLFEFFFFDGEEISNLFADASYNAYIKNAVLTLCGYDTFGIIKKFCDGYVDTDRSDQHSEQLLEQFRAQSAELEKLDRSIAAAEHTLQELEIKQAAAADQKLSLEAQFKKAGGLGKEEREALNDQLRQYDRMKSEQSKVIRDYVEGLMPFGITLDLARKIEAQLPREERMRQYLATREQLSADMLKEAITAAEVVAPDQAKTLAERLCDSISAALCPEQNPEQFRFIHDLSTEQRNQVSAVLGQLAQFDRQDLIRAIEEKRIATSKYDQASRALREALPELDANDYWNRLHVLSFEISECENAISTTRKQLEKLSTARPDMVKSLDTLRAQIQSESRNKTAYLYTSRISRMMDLLISDIAHEKFQQIERATLQMFRDVTHKDNFIDLMELDSSFNILIYKEQTYRISELYALLENIGTEELQKRLGHAGMKTLLDWFQIPSTRTLKRSIRKYLAEGTGDSRAEHPLKLYKRMELSSLSKGEKQVFLLSLYWAIIQSSGQHVPFTIDTPFARIDTEHREQLTKLFFPTVSDQVIILSTDEELVGPYHEIIRDQIAHEYLLSNEEIAGRTSVRPGYFQMEGVR